MQVLRVEDIKKSFNIGKKKFEVLKGVSFSLNEGEIINIMGSSGSGKTTLLNILGALDVPDEGKIYLEEKYQKNFHIEPYATEFRSLKLGFVFQSFNLLKDLNVEENVALPLVLQGVPKEEIKKRVEKELESVGLLKWGKHRISELSGGQQQRVCIARAMITRPPILLADEPTGNLDHNTSLEILSLFKKMRDEFNQSIIMVTHDPLVASYGDRVLFFKDGNIVEDYKVDSNKDNVDSILLKFKEVLK